MKILCFHAFMVALCALSACGGINRYFDGITSDSYTPTVRLIKESPESVIELSPDNPQYRDRLSRLKEYFFYRLRWNEPLKDTRTIRLTERRFSALQSVKSSEKDTLRTVVFERNTLESPLFRIKREGKSSLESRRCSLSRYCRLPTTLPITPWADCTTSHPPVPTASVCLPN